MPKLFDAYDTPGVADHADEIKAAGFGGVALYYFNTSQYKKQLTRDAAEKLSAAGLWIVSIYENGSPTSADYFSAGKGAFDGGIAVQRAEAAGQPKGTWIYPTVDYDASQNDLLAIEEYFRAFNAKVTGAGYKTGVYGSGLVCRTLKTAGIVSKTWLTQSHGWAGYGQWLQFADMVQGHVTSLFGVDADLDTSAASGGGGWRLPAIS